MDFIYAFFAPLRDVTAICSAECERTRERGCARGPCLRERKTVRGKRGRETENSSERARGGGSENDRGRPLTHPLAGGTPAERTNRVFFHHHLPLNNRLMRKGLAIVRGTVEQRLRSLIVSSVVPQSANRNKIVPPAHYIHSSIVREYCTIIIRCA